MPWYGWLLNILLFSFVPLAIIAVAIALPAYQQYVSRAQGATGTAVRQVAIACRSNNALPEQPLCRVSATRPLPVVLTADQRPSHQRHVLRCRLVLRT